MAKDEKEFEHESLQNRRAVVAYLAALQEGFENGTLSISDPTDRIDLKPNGLVHLEVHASQKRDRVRLVLRFQWKNNGQNSKRSWPLTLKGGEDEG
jgi:amphi-Trp domain-containing protein